MKKTKLFLLLFNLFLCAFTAAEVNSSYDIPTDKRDIKKQIFLFAQQDADRLVSGLGISYRPAATYGFYDVAIAHSRHTFILPSLPTQYVKGLTTSASIIASRALATNTKYVKLYVLAGAGVNYHSTSLGRFTPTFCPLVAVKIGLGFKYGFIDIGYNIPLITLKYIYQDSKNDAFTRWTKNYNLIGDSRIGLGFSF